MLDRIEVPVGDDAVGSHAAASNRPEEIGVSRLVGDDHGSIGEGDRRRVESIDRETVRPHQIPDLIPGRRYARFQVGNFRGQQLLFMIATVETVSRLTLLELAEPELRTFLLTVSAPEVYVVRLGPQVFEVADKAIVWLLAIVEAL